jgi:hypothetical protein
MKINTINLFLMAAAFIHFNCKPTQSNTSNHKGVPLKKGLPVIIGIQTNNNKDSLTALTSKRLEALNYQVIPKEAFQPLHKQAMDEVFKDLKNRPSNMSQSEIESKFLNMRPVAQYLSVIYYSSHDKIDSLGYTILPMPAKNARSVIKRNMDPAFVNQKPLTAALGLLIDSVTISH